MAMYAEPELTSSHRLTESAATYGTNSSEKKKKKPKN